MYINYSEFNIQYRHQIFLQNVSVESVTEKRFGDRDKIAVCVNIVRLGL